MKYSLKKTLIALIPISKQYSFKYQIRRVKEILNWLCLWEWQFVVQLASRKLFETRIYYLGRKSNLDAITSMLGFHKAKLTSKSHHKLVLTELPIPTFLRIPHYLTTIIPLSRRSPKEMLQLMSKRKRKFLRNRRAQYHMREISENAEINRINFEMIMPYAQARYGKGVAHLTDEEIEWMAKKNGKLHLVYFKNQEIACHIGFASKRGDSKFWQGHRAGYPKFVHNNNRLFREANLMNTYMEIEWAHQNGFDNYDLGYTVAMPDNGVLQWKRSFRGNLICLETSAIFTLNLQIKIGRYFSGKLLCFQLKAKQYVSIWDFLIIKN